MIDRRTKLAIAAVLVAGAAIRMIGATGRAPWLDEAFCIRVAHQDWSGVITHAAGDNHPPLFFSVLKVWIAMFGESFLAMHLLDVLIAVVTIWLVYVLARRILIKHSAAVLAAAWLAMHTSHVFASAQIRMYPLAGLLAVASALLLLRALDRPLAWWRWAAWTLAAVALVYTHYYGGFVVLAQGAHALVVAWHSPNRRAVLVRVIASGVAVCIAFAPWIGVVLTQSARVAESWWVPALTPARVVWSWARIPGLLVESESIVPSGLVAAGLGALAVATFGAVAVAAVQRDRGLRLVAWCTLVPLVGGIAVSLAIGQNVILARYLIVAQVFAPIALVGIVWRWWQLVPLGLVALAMLAVQLPQFVAQPDWPAAVAWIAERRQPQDIVLARRFNYWSLRTGMVDDRQLHQFMADNRSTATITDEFSSVGPAIFTHPPGRVVVVDSVAVPLGVPPNYHALEHARFRTWMPRDEDHALDVTIYEENSHFDTSGSHPFR